jgi:hypothetical protein
MTNDKPLTEKDFDFKLFAMPDEIKKKVQSAKRLLKKRLRRLTGFLNIIDEVDACFQIDDNQEAAKGGKDISPGIKEGLSLDKPPRKSLKPIWHEYNKM